MNYVTYFQNRYAKADRNTFACLGRLHNPRDMKADERGEWAEKFFRVDDAEGMASFVERWRDTCNVYNSLNVFQSQKRAKANCAQILRLWTDIDPTEYVSREDVEKIAHAITEFTQKVDTGGGFQIEWDLPKPVQYTEELDKRLDSYLSQLVTRHSGDSGAKGVNRVSRVPGTLNFPDHAKAVKKGRGWDPLPVGEAVLTGKEYTPDDLGLSQPATSLTSTTPLDGNIGTRHSTPINLPGKLWDLVEQGDQFMVNRKRKYDSLSEALMGALHKMVAYTDSDDLIRAIVLHPNHAIGEKRRNRIDKLTEEIEKARIAFEQGHGGRINEYLERFKVVVVGGSTLVFDRLDEQMIGQEVSNFKTRLENITVPNVFMRSDREAHVLTMAEAVMRCPWRQTYDAFTMTDAAEPFAVVPYKGRKLLNAYVGLGVQPAASEVDLTPWWDHLTKVLCAGDKDVAQWLTRWCAFTVQNPLQRAQSVPVFRSVPGVGKGTLGEQFQAIFGRHFSSVGELGMIVSYRNWLEWKLLIVLEETVWGGSKADAAKIREIITNPLIRADNKNQKSADMQNRCSFLMFTNADWAVPAQWRERRYCVMDCDPNVRDLPTSEQVAYFNNLRDLMNGGGREAWLHTLLTMPLDDWTPFKPPVTAATLEQAELSADAFDRWLQRFLDDACLETAAGTEYDTHWHPVVPTELMYQSYRSQCRRNEIPDASTLFVRKLSKALPHIRPVRRVTWIQQPTDGLTSREPVESTKRGYELGSLNDCRKHFERFVGRVGSITWHEAQQTDDFTETYRASTGELQPPVSTDTLLGEYRTAEGREERTKLRNALVGRGVERAVFMSGVDIEAENRLHELFEQYQGAGLDRDVF